MATKDFRKDERLSFLRIDADAREALRQFHPVLEKHLKEILDGFYDHLVSQPELAALVGDGQNIARLKAAQTEHWNTLFSGVFDDAYMDRVVRIGNAHARIGLDPRWYMAGYCFALNGLMAAAVQVFGRKPAKLVAVVSAVNKAVFLDMDLAMSVYQDQLRDEHRRKLNELAEELEKNVMNVVAGVNTAATGMKESAESMSATAEETDRQATAVAAAAEEAATNVQTVASAAEELSSSIDEISRQVAGSSEMSQGAVTEAERADATVQGLAEAASKIGEVVELINDIASQTNLLALNATIEAARAGDAGKGFAVVASEVKSLANQTAKATDDISAQITAIQEATGGAVGAIQGIGKTIASINEIATAIASAVEEQGAATAEIARNISQASTGTQEVTANIAGVTEAAGETGQAAKQVLTVAADVSGHADTLKEEVEKFLNGIKAA